ncbi:restriction endonuclease subunit S [Gallicola sp. Sow4_E12]|uniref:restriction endonuclease subunit S n=1 Tax=Gallicola sp. Sow4_E12 TaxID=3438785 RepID=UPI003F90BA2E
MEFKPYEEYKKVDLPWIDKIPSHWEIDRGKNLFKQEKRKVKAEDEVITCFRDGEVTLRKNRRTTSFTESIQEIGYQEIKKGDLVIHQMDSFAGAAGVSDSDGKGSPILSICNGKILLNNYYYAFIVREMAHNGFIMSLSRGIRERSTDFRFKTFAEQLYPFPPKEEQDKIVDFLDYNLGKIDKFVELTERQIALLKEQKEVIINDAVTKGIDKNVGYKDSGIDWIGQIPRHWETFKNRHFLNENKNVVGSKSKEFNLLSLTKKGIIKRDLENPKGKFPSSFETYKIVKRNDIVFCLFDIDETPRTVGLSGLDGMITGAYNVFTINGINKFYLYYYYLAIDNKKALKSLYSGLRKTIRSNIFLGMEIPVPPINEQEIIVEYIYRETSKIDRTVELYKKEISLIKEYKTALIANAVTGKIDVRDYRLN